MGSMTVYQDQYLSEEEFLSLQLIPDNDNIWDWYDGPLNFLSIDKNGQKYISLKIDWYHARNEDRGWCEYLHIPVTDSELQEYIQKHKFALNSESTDRFFRNFSIPHVFIHRDPYYNAPTIEVWKYPLKDYYKFIDDLEFIYNNENLIRDAFISSFEVYCFKHQKLTYCETAKTPSRLIYGMKCKECGKEITWIQDRRPNASFQSNEVSLLNNEVEPHLSCKCGLCGKSMEYQVDKGHCFKCECGNKIRVIVWE